MPPTTKSQTRTPPLASLHSAHRAIPTPLGLTALGTLILLAAGPDDERYTIPVPVRGLGLSPKLADITNVCVTPIGNCDCDCDWVRLSWSCTFLLYMSTPPGRGGCSPGCKSFSGRGTGLGGPLLFLGLTNGTDDTCSFPFPIPKPQCDVRLDIDGLGVDREELDADGRGDIGPVVRVLRDGREVLIDGRGVPLSDGRGRPPNEGLGTPPSEGRGVPMPAPILSLAFPL